MSEAEALWGLARTRLRSGRRLNAVVGGPTDDGAAADADGQRTSSALAQRTSNVHMRASRVGKEAEMRKLLINAQAQGRVLERRVQYPSMGVGVFGYVILVVLAVAAPRTPMVETFGVLIAVASAVVLLFSASMRAYVVSIIVMCFGVIAVAVVLNNLHRTTGVVRTCSGTDACCGLGFYGLQAKLLFGDAPCWFLWYHLRFRLFFRAAAGAQASLRVGVFYVRRLRPRQLVVACWHAVGQAMALLAIGDCFTAAAMVALDLVGSNGAEFAYTLIRLLVEVGLSAFCLRRDARKGVQRWLASRGECVSTAVGIASLIGTRGVDDVQQQALSTLRSIRIDLLSKVDLESNAPSMDLFARSAPARFGEIDGALCIPHWLQGCSPCHSA